MPKSCACVPRSPTQRGKRDRAAHSVSSACSVPRTAASEISEELRYEYAPRRSDGRVAPSLTALSSCELALLEPRSHGSEQNPDHHGKTAECGSRRGFGAKTQRGALSSSGLVGSAAGLPAIIHGMRQQAGKSTLPGVLTSLLRTAVLLVRLRGRTTVVARELAVVRLRPGVNGHSRAPLTHCSRALRQHEHAART
jgi:hypothetical protein